MLQGHDHIRPHVLRQRNRIGTPRGRPHVESAVELVPAVVADALLRPEHIAIPCTPHAGACVLKRHGDLQILSGECNANQIQHGRAVRRFSAHNAVADHARRAVAASVSQRWSRMAIALNSRKARTSHQTGLEITAHLAVACVSRGIVSTVKGTVDRLVAINFTAQIIVETRFEETFSVVDTVSIVTITNIWMVARTKEWCASGDVIPLARCMFLAHVAPGLSIGQVESWQFISRSTVQIQERCVSLLSGSNSRIDMLRENVIRCRAGRAYRKVARLPLWVSCRAGNGRHACNEVPLEHFVYLGDREQEAEARPCVHDAVANQFIVCEGDQLHHSLLARGVCSEPFHLIIGDTTQGNGIVEPHTVSVVSEDILCQVVDGVQGTAHVTTCCQSGCQRNLFRGAHDPAARCIIHDLRMHPVFTTSDVVVVENSSSRVFWLFRALN